MESTPTASCSDYVFCGPGRLGAQHSSFTYLQPEEATQSAHCHGIIPVLRNIESYIGLFVQYELWSKGYEYLFINIFLAQENLLRCKLPFCVRINC
jgi:hypothetical protein